MKIARSLLVAVFALSSVASAEAQCPTSDDITIQNAIGAAAAAGGGTVQLQARAYDICQPIMLLSDVHLRGFGIGATILRTRGGPPSGPAAWVGASIVGVGVANVSVVGLTLDQRTNGRVANGIAFVPSNPDFSGAVPYNILIERNHVIGTPAEGGHQYMIWNMRGQHVKIVNNWVDGGFYSPSSIPVGEGIESFGGYDVLVEGNTVKGISGTCLNFGAAGEIPDTYTVGVFVKNNYAFLCNIGVNIGAGHAAQQAGHAIVSDNVIIYAWQAGITVAAGTGHSLRNIQIKGNSIRQVGGGRGPGVADGILLYAASGGNPLNTTVEGNQVDSVTGIGFGIRLESYPHARLVNNTVFRTAREGIYATNASNIEMKGNRVEGVGLRGIYTGPAAQVQIVTDNLIVDWGAGSIGIHLEGVIYGVVRGNVFRRSDSARPEPLAVSGTCGVTVDGNVALYPGAINNGPPPGC
jgi:parallel beta-helix repeat protein